MKKIYFVILSVCFSLASCCPSFPDDKMTVLGSNYLHKILIDTNIRSFIEPNYSEMHFFDLATFIFDDNVQSIEWNCEIVLINFKKDKFKLQNADNVNSIKSTLNRCGPEVSGIHIPYSFRYNTNVQCSNSLKPYFLKKLNGSSTLFFGEDESKMQFEIGVAKGFSISYFIIEKNGKEYFLSIIYNNQLNMLHTFNKILRNSNCKIKHWQELK